MHAHRSRRGRHRAEAGTDGADQLPFTPKWTLNVGVQDERQIGALESLSLHADCFYRSDFSLQADNMAFDFQEGCGPLDLRSVHTLPNERVCIAAST
ncbi:MAG: hypothetical protein AAGH48_00280 [Pseudomonadota bacterium]